MRRWFAKVVKSAVRLESWSRTRAAKRHYIRRRKALILMQSFGRMLRCRRLWNTHIYSATLIQANIRKHQAMKTLKRSSAKLVGLQSQVRAFLAMRLFNRQIISILLLQAQGRKMICCRRYSLNLMRVVRLQSVMRKRLARAKYAVAMKAVVKIQSFARMMKAIRKLEKSIFSVILMQTTARRLLAVLSYRLYRKQMRSLIHIQALQSWLACVEIIQEASERYYNTAELRAHANCNEVA